VEISVNIGIAVDSSSIRRDEIYKGKEEELVLTSLHDP